jgi:4-hydroxy-tetrahydrodipicolinate synthase
MFSGAITAMVTPFHDGRVDEDRLRQNVDFQIDNGIDGLVPCGTTGESPTLSHDEHDHVIEVVVDAAAGRVPVIAGTGSNSTAEAIRLTKHARQAGAAASLQVNPYYNKPTQEGLYRHFMAVADGCDLPIVLYNIPGRSGVALSPETIERLAQHEKIVAIKEATGSLDIASEIAARCGEKLTIISGDDSLTLPLFSVGGRGVISVLSNFLPDRIKALCDAGLAGDFATARKLHLKLFPIMKGMLSLETNPIPIKAAMHMAGMDSGELRLPMCQISDDNRGKLEALLRANALLG